MPANNSNDPFGACSELRISGDPVQIHRLDALIKQNVGHVDRLPFSIKVLLEAVLRNVDGFTVRAEDVERLARWDAKDVGSSEVPFKPARVLLQDFTGVPAVVDLAAMRDAVRRLGGDPKRINPLIPVDLIIDHSVQVDYFARPDALDLNAEIEFQRNRERYEFLRWGKDAFDNFRVVPPATGICHQVNLEYLAKVVARRSENGRDVAIPDTLVGTDSHTTMINGLGVVGWGVGGIEAEAVMLGQPIYMLTPEVIGFKLSGRLAEGATATDLVLTVTEMLRRKGVVGKFVEFYGQGLSNMTLPDRATIANMSPEYGATMGFFPVDAETLDYLRRTGRSDDEIDLVERYTKEQGIFRTDETPDPEYTDALELDLSTVEPSLAGPRRPQDRINLSAMHEQWRQDLTNIFGKTARTGTSTVSSWEGEGGQAIAVAEPVDATEDGIEVEYNGQSFRLNHGSVVIAAITSCTNTSNPSVMLGAGLLARKAVQKGLKVKPWVKTSLAPGSRVVTDYLQSAGVLEDLDKLGFSLVGYGCTTCIGNSGPLPDPIAKAVDKSDLVVASVLSGNRNFEGRVHAQVKASYLASPPLVVAYALAGNVDVDLTHDSLGTGSDGKPVYLKDIWPSPKEILDSVAANVSPESFRKQYADVFTGNQKWNKISAEPSETYPWDQKSTYIQNPPFFEGLTPEAGQVEDIRGARVLVMVGDSITTDHISPAGTIKPDSPAGRHLQDHGVQIKDFNSYGSRRGNDRVMTRGTFANVRLRNLLAPGTEGGVTTHVPSGEQMSIYDASIRYKQESTPLIVLGGKEYGTGSSRDWAAKGTLLLGVRAVIAQSFERIHRSNLVGMGVLPLQFKDGDSRESLGLTGKETFDIQLTGSGADLRPGQDVQVKATGDDGRTQEFAAKLRLDTPVDVDYYRNGGILHTVLRNLFRD